MKDMNTKIPVAVLGATGMVGRRFVEILADHPWFEVIAVAASSRSAGKRYGEALAEKGATASMSERLRSLKVFSIEEDKERIAKAVRIAFSAFYADAADTRRIEEEYAALGMAVVSNNSANRWTEDVPLVIPEVNGDHIALIETQRSRRGWGDGCIVVKPNCSLQSYVPAIHALAPLGVERVAVTTMQAVSGAGRTLDDWPEMLDNVIPFISGEEEKSELEPLKILGRIADGTVVPADMPKISATCIRVPVSDGHMASIFIQLKKKATAEEIIGLWERYEGGGLMLPSAPRPPIKYFYEDDRPQTRFDRNEGRGMRVSIGRLREDTALGWKFVALSHNTIRGAAGGAVLIGELLVEKGYIRGI